MSRQQLGGLLRVPVTELEPSPENPRERMTGIDELAQSMREVGLIQPIVAQRIPASSRLRIVAGHRRWLAARKLGWSHVPVLVRQDMLPDEELVHMLVENGQRADLDPVEEARAIRFLVRQGYTQAQVARKIGRSPVHIGNRLMLLTLSKREQEALRVGDDTLGAALERARKASGHRLAADRPRNAGWHFAHTHPLGAAAKTRCGDLGHGKARKVSGAVACGECWEQVIRADERRKLQDASASRGSCVLCDSALGEVAV